MARPKKSSVEASQKGINVLKRSIQRDLSKGKNKPPVVEEQQPPVVEEQQPPVVEEQQPPVVEEQQPPVVEQTPPPVVEETPPVIEPTVNDGKPKITLFDDLKKKTKEDDNITDKVKELANQATGISAAAEEISTKEANQAKAGIIIELIDVGFMLVCLLITWDFSDTNQKFYSLHKDRKRAIQLNLEKIYNASNKKQEPKKAIVWLIVGSYVPLLVLAIFSMIARLRDKKEKKEREQREYRERELANRNNTEENGNQENSQQQNQNQNQNSNHQQPKKDGRGRKAYPRDKYGNIIRPKNKR